MDLIEFKRHPIAHRRVPYWKSKDGYIAIRDITDRHLIQIALYLYRTATQKQQEELRNAYKFWIFFDPESDASYAADQIIFQLEDMDAGEYVEKVLAPEVFKELDKRNLDIYAIMHPPLRIIFDD